MEPSVPQQGTTQPSHCPHTLPAPSSTGWSESQLQRSGKSPSAAIPEGSFHNQQLSPHLDCYGDCRKTHRKHWKQLSNNQLCRHSIQQGLTGGNLTDKKNQLVTLIWWGDTRKCWRLFACFALKISTETLDEDHFQAALMPGYTPLPSCNCCLRHGGRFCYKTPLVFCQSRNPLESWIKPKQSQTKQPPATPQKTPQNKQTKKLHQTSAIYFSQRF